MFKYYLRFDEPARSIVLVLRDLILEYDERITTSIRYGMPFFFFGKKRFAYLWVEKKTGWPYIGFTDGFKMMNPHLVTEGRKRMKILRFDPEVDIPLDVLYEVLDESRSVCLNGS